MKTAFKRRARGRRGITLLEILLSGAISAIIFGIAIGVYVQGTRGFHRNQAQAYTQFRTRTSLDEVAREVRSAKSVLPTYGSYASVDGTGTAGACVILQVPAQDSATMGVFYYGSGGASPNALVTDTVIYRHNKADKTLRRTIIPARDVTDRDGVVRNSYRPEVADMVAAANVGSLRFTFHNRDGAAISTGLHRTAAVDIATNIQQERAGQPMETADAYAISGVRLRNMRSGSIPGIVTTGGAPLANALLLAIYTSANGAYQTGTIVGKATSDASGLFEIFGLETGTYTVKAYAVENGLVKATVPDIFVPEEDAADSVTVTVS